MLRDWWCGSVGCTFRNIYKWTTYGTTDNMIFNVLLFFYTQSDSIRVADQKFSSSEEGCVRVDPPPPTHWHKDIVHLISVTDLHIKTMKTQRHISVTTLCLKCIRYIQIIGLCGVVGSTLAFRSTGHAFESEQRSFSQHSASACSKLSWDHWTRFCSLPAIVHSASYPQGNCESSCSVPVVVLQG